MKTILILVSVLFISTITLSQKYRFEQNFKLSELEDFKNSKVYIGLGDNEEANDALRLAVRNSWDFTEIAGEETMESIKKRADKGEKVSFIGVVVSKSSNLFSGKSGVDASSKTFSLQINTEGSKYGMYHQYLCYAEGFKNDRELSFDLGVKMLNSKLKTIASENLKKSKDIKGVAQNRVAVFRSKTLYIPREWLNEITEQEFKSEYSEKVKFVDLVDYIEAIKNGKEDMIFVLPVAVPAEGGFVNTHIFTEADGYKYLGLCQRLSFGELQTNIFNAYDGTITKKHLKLYSDTARGKW